MAEASHLVLGGEDYELLTEGAAFRLRCKGEQRAAYLDGDEAARFRSDLEIVQQQFPGCTADHALAQLWDQGGYGWLAVDEEA
ncbi:hypothetical protein [Azorhizobium doebereinerae]|uniref:hypothetical protein n=1 Tax=Azorhizobium doebereinerae TaxID=281091 RepID=UPI00042628EC|nr:hypothetical protein [Azorhizobium doebereinerae]